MSDQHARIPRRDDRPRHAQGTCVSSAGEEEVEEEETGAWPAVR